MSKVIEGEPCLDLDGLPLPDFAEYYEQLRRYLPDSVLQDAAMVWLPYETSRGCWWGAKHHCTFCGLNGATLTHREKSPDRVLADLKQLTVAHPTRRICMSDNIMPHSYFRSLVPRLAEEVPGVEIFYEQKSNLTLGQVSALRRSAECS